MNLFSFKDDVVKELGKTQLRLHHNQDYIRGPEKSKTTRIIREQKADPEIQKWREQDGVVEQNADDGILEETSNQIELRNADDGILEDDLRKPVTRSSYLLATDPTS